MTLEDSIQTFRLRVLREAVRSGNISATCQRYEISLRSPTLRAISRSEVARLSQ